MPKIFQTPDGVKWAVDPETGVKRVASEEDIENSVPIGVDLEGPAGLGLLERFTFKNLTNSPEAGKQYLKKLGYEVRALPESAGAWNFAVRKGPSEPWKPVDPQRMEAEDLMDLGADAVLGISEGLAFTLGTLIGSPILGAGAAAAVGGGLEAARQGAGIAAGVPQEFDPLGVGLEAGIGGVSAVAAPAVGRAAKFFTTKVSKGLRRVGEEVGLDLASNLTEMGTSAAFKAEERLVFRTQLAGEGVTSRLARLTPGGVRRVRGGGQELVKPERAAAMISNVVKKAFRDLEYVETGLKEQVLREAGEAGIIINGEKALAKMFSLKPIVDEKGIAQAATAEARQLYARNPGLASRIDAITEDVIKFVDETTGGAEHLDSLSPATADKLRGHIANEWGNVADAWTVTVKGNKPTDFGGVIQEATRGLRNQLFEDMGGEKASAKVIEGVTNYGRRYHYLQRRIAHKQMLRESTRRNWGAHLKGVQAIAKANSTLGTLWGRSGTAPLRALRSIERYMDMEPNSLINLAREAELARSIAAGATGGKMKIVPRFTAAGKLLGPSLISGAGGFLGFQQGGLEGALTGAGIGITLASPRNILLMTRKGLQMGQKLQGFETALGALKATPAMKTAGVASAASLLRPMAAAGVAREGQERRRRRGPAVLIGQ